MNRAALSLCALTLGCATAAPRVDAPTAVSSTPPWAEPAEGAAAPARALAEPARDRWASVRIPAAVEVDPLDRLLSRRRGARRLSQLALRDAPAGDTLRMLAELGGFDVVFADDVGDRRVTLQLRGVTLSSALRVVLASAHLGAEVGAGEVLRVGPRTAAQ